MSAGIAQIQDLSDQADLARSSALWSVVNIHSRSEGGILKRHNF